MNSPLPVPLATLEEPTRLILESYQRWFGSDLVEADAPERATAALFEAPCVVLASRGQPGGDSAFCYANRAALELFETPWEQIVGMPSSRSAEAEHRAERRRLLDEVDRHGFIENYSGIRISRTGRRFRILHARVFNLLDGAGNYAGQAAVFADWEPIN